jgi:hypothetical protein
MPALSVNDIAILLEFFNYVDTDHDGFITVAEIRAAVTDTNADGTNSKLQIVASSLPWLTALTNQYIDGDSRITLSELMECNANVKKTIA